MVRPPLVGDGFSIEAAQLAPAADSERHLLGRFLARHYAYAGAYPRHTLPQPQDAVLAGLAYGLLPELTDLRSLASGALVDLAPGSWWDVSLAWHAWNIDTPFIHALSEQVAHPRAACCGSLSAWPG